MVFYNQYWTILPELFALQVGGMMWRTSPTLTLNRIRLQHYITTEDAEGYSNRVWFDDVVVSTEWIGSGITNIEEHVYPDIRQSTNIRICPLSGYDIRFEVILEKPGMYTLEVYDLLGKKLLKHRQMNAEKGANTIDWNRRKRVPYLMIVVLKYAGRQQNRMFVVF